MSLLLLLFLFEREPFTVQTNRTTFHLYYTYSKTQTLYACKHLCEDVGGAPALDAPMTNPRLAVAARCNGDAIDGADGPDRISFISCFIETS